MVRNLLRTAVLNERPMSKVRGDKLKWWWVSAVIIIAICTRFGAITNPSGVFWDENFFVAAAQKYLHGVFFMEPHPPLGKLLIAGGEIMVGENETSDHFLDTDYPGEAPEGFSMFGYRFIPTLLGAGAGVILYFIFLSILRNSAWSFALTSLYLFDNALTLHTRGALLEGPQIFFGFAMILVFLKLRGLPSAAKSRGVALWAILGAFFGCGVATKLSGAIFLMLPAVALFQSAEPRVARLKHALTFIVAASVVYISVWVAHFSLGREIRPSPQVGSGFYYASPAYREALKNGAFSPVLDFGLAFRDHWRYFQSYERKVPSLNLCQPSEPGSYPLLWPIGATPQAYRWKALDSDTWRMWYMVPNPFVWFFVLVSVVVGTSLLISSVTLPSVKLQDRPLLVTLLGMYFGYMVVMLNIPRVMYISHYLIPLCVGIVICGAVFRELQCVGSRALSDSARSIIATAILVFSVIGFTRYAPFTYGTPLTVQEIRDRSLLSLWNLRCPSCPSRHPLARPVGGSLR